MPLVVKSLISSSVQSRIFFRISRRFIIIDLISRRPRANITLSLSLFEAKSWQARRVSELPSVSSVTTPS